jgi:hypothetical protein
MHTHAQIHTHGGGQCSEGNGLIDKTDRGGGLRLDRHTVARNSTRIDDLLGAQISCGPPHLSYCPVISIAVLFFSLFFFCFFILSTTLMMILLKCSHSDGGRRKTFLLKVLQQHYFFNPAGKKKVFKHTQNTWQRHFFVCLMSLLDGEGGEGCYAS